MKEPTLNWLYPTIDWLLTFNVLLCFLISSFWTLVFLNINYRTTFTDITVIQTKNFDPFQDPIFDIAKEVKFKLKYFYICRESFIKSELVKMPNRTSKKKGCHCSLAYGWNLSVSNILEIYIFFFICYTWILIQTFCWFSEYSSLTMFTIFMF